MHFDGYENVTIDFQTLRLLVLLPDMRLLDHNSGFTRLKTYATKQRNGNEPSILGTFLPSHGPIAIVRPGKSERLTKDLIVYTESHRPKDILSLSYFLLVISSLSFEN